MYSLVITFNPFQGGKNEIAARSSCGRQQASQEDRRDLELGGSSGKSPGGSDECPGRVLHQNLPQERREAGEDPETGMGGEERGLIKEVNGKQIKNLN